jgi:ABC-type multidrug transport system ATPase subunit
VTVNALNRSGTGQQILDRVSGVAEAGKMLAIMGASGAGKSTLLDTLFGRLNRSRYEVTGSIKYYQNSRYKKGSLFLRPEDVGYVHQVCTKSETMFNFTVF